MSNESLPEWLATESAVTELFASFGFNVQHVEIAGRQIDLLAARSDVFSIEPERWVIEITTEYVDVNKGSKDSQKLLLASQETGCRMMLVSTSGFAGPQLETLKKLGIVCRTYAELERQFLDLGRYAAVIRQTRLQTPDNDIGFDATVFVEPDVHVHSSPDDPENSTTALGTQWVQNICTSSRGVVGALLGNLGSGKTTILQRAQLAMIEDFLTDPSNRPLPIYVPLSRYKHHSGRVDSLLQETLAEAGIPNYPTLLIKHLSRHGRLAFLFDGLDEVHPLQSVDDIVSTVTNILDYLGKSARAVVSSRTHLFSSRDEELALFGPYEKSKISEVSNSLHRLLAGHASTELAYVQPFTPEQINDYLQRACGDDYKKVREQINSIYGFGDMARTPVLLAMMRRTLPEMVAGGHQFSIVPQLDLYTSYTQRWIYRDDKRAQLSSKQRLGLSRSLAINLIKRDDYAASWQEIRDLLHADESWRDKPVSDSAAEFDVRNSTFLIRESDDSFRFVHRSIMEYFAAMNSYDRLVSGARAELSLTDGHAKFLAMFVARNWHTDNSGELPFRKPKFNLDDWADQKLLSLVSAATLLLPPEGPKPRLSTTLIGDHCESCHLYAIDIRGLSINIGQIGMLRFENCDIRELHLTVRREVGTIDFLNCGIEKSHASLTLQGWREVRIEPVDHVDDSSVASLGLPDGYAVASRWVEFPNCVAEIGNARWNVPFRNLVLASAVARRFGGRVKISIESWDKGPFAGELHELLPKLAGSAGLVARDTSRRPHQLQLSPDGNALFAGLQKDPLQYQTQLLAFNVPRNANNG